MEDGNGEDSSGNMPWSAFNAYFKFAKEKDPKNFFAECKLCVKKELRSCSYTSSNNLKQHLMRAHNWTQEKLNSEFSVKPASRKRKSTSDLGDSGGSGSATHFFQPKKKLTQEDLNKAVDEFIICTRQSHRIVDNEKFRQLVLLGLPPNLKINCRQTLRNRMNVHFKTMQDKMIKEFSGVQYFAATADGWSKFRRGFIGVEVTWLDPKTIDRQFAGLSLQRMKGHHTYDRIGKAIGEIFDSYQLQGKVVMCTTDSGSNFVKAFRVFGPDDLPQPESEPGMEEDDVDEDDLLAGDEQLASMDLNAILHAAETDGIALPPHTRCGSHIINRMATGNALEPLETNATYKRLYESTEAKLRVYWRRQNQSTLVAEAIQEGFGVKLVIPGETRWNSRFDAKQQIVKLSNDEEKFNEVVEKAGLPKLLKTEIKFMKEYCHVMQPVAFALDILQKDKNMYLGYLLPTILCIEKHLVNASKLDDKPLKYCEPLRKSLHAAIRKPNRFLHQLENRNNEMAAALIPAFMLNDWVPSQGQRDEIKESIFAELEEIDNNKKQQEAPAATTGNPRTGGRLAVTEVKDDEWQEEDGADLEVDADVDLSAEDKFFGFGPQVSNAQQDSPSETAAEELDRYLQTANRGWTVQRCYGVPRLAQLFLNFNTALPSSASIERFFSGAGLSFRDIRCALGDLTLEKEVLLSINKRFWS